MQNSGVETAQRTPDDELTSLKRQVTSLAKSVESLQAQLAGQSKILAELAAGIKSMAGHPQPASAVAGQETAASPDDAISPQLLVVIAAAVTAFLGKKVRIRSAKNLQSPYEIINPWAQQGRVFVQASHNLSRG